MSNHILEVNHLTKRFGSFTAVNNISFTVGEGEIVGLLGPNGAGKTTTIHMLLGLVTASGGTISYFGRDFSKEREYSLSHINFASTYAHLQGRLTVMQNFHVYCGLYQIKHWKEKTMELLNLLEVGHLKDELFWQLSSGQKTRVILAKALLNNPRLILMDEPTASLDPDIADKVVDLIADLQKKEKVSILLTSHNMEEVERLCDRVIFLDHGTIVAEDTPLGLTKRVGDVSLIVTFDGSAAKVSKYLKEKKFVHEFSRKQIVEISVVEKDIPTVLFGLGNDGVWITNIEVERPNLEDVFLSIARGDYRNNTSNT